MNKTKKIKNIRIVLGCIALLLYLPAAFSLSYPLPKPGNNIVGNVFTIYSEPGNTLKSIGRQYDIGYEAMLRANPNFDTDYLKPWTKVVIPSAFILPNVPRQGIVINLPEMRLYYFPSGKNVVVTYPIGIGRAGWETPTVETTVSAKKLNPTWTVPKSIKEHMATRGLQMPNTVAPGPDNPLGKYAIRLDLPGYLIHSTNRPFTVGKRSTSGCIRLYPEDMQSFYSHVEVGTPVKIINQAYKAGWYEKKLYLEAHQPFWDINTDKQNSNTLQQAITAVTQQQAVNINWQQTRRIAQQYLGYPQYISAR